MMKYNDKKFLLGVFFLLLAVASIIMFIMHSGRASIMIFIFCVAIGITEILRSLNKNSIIEDKKFEDERQQYIYTKAGNTTFVITFFLCISMIIILALKGSQWWSVTLVGPMVTILGVLAFTMILVWIISYFFYNKKI